MRGLSPCVQHKQKNELSQEQPSACLPFPGFNHKRLLLACVRVGGNAITEQKMLFLLDSLTLHRQQLCFSTEHALLCGVLDWPILAVEKKKLR